MVDPFGDQRRFMQACGQSTDQCDLQQYGMYIGLIEEETKELAEAINNNDPVEQLDALIDILVVTIGALHSLGADAEGAWNEVMRSNLAKIDPTTGRVNKRADGKILKPEGWTPPVLQNFLKSVKIAG